MVFDFSVGLILAIIGITLMSALVQSASGVGYGGAFMIFMPAVLGYSGALGLMYISYSLVMTITAFYTFRQVDMKKCFKIAFPCLITNAIGVIIGTVCVKMIEKTNTEILSLILGIAISLISLYFFIVSSKVKITPTVPKGLALGSVGGLMCGFFGQGGPPISIYILNATDSANEYLAAIQIPYIASTVTGIVMHIIAGSFTPAVWGAAAVSVIPTVAGCAAGLWLANKVDGLILKRIVYSVLLAMGILLIVQNI